MHELDQHAFLKALTDERVRWERIKPILDLCISRFNAFAKVQDRGVRGLRREKLVRQMPGRLVGVRRTASGHRAEIEIDPGQMATLPEGMTLVPGMPHASRTFVKSHGMAPQLLRRELRCRRALRLPQRHAEANPERDDDCRSRRHPWFPK